MSEQMFTREYRDQLGCMVWRHIDKKRQGAGLKVGRFFLEMTRMDKISNEIVRGIAQIEPLKDGLDISGKRDNRRMLELVGVPVYLFYCFKLPQKKRKDSHKF